MAKRRWTDEEMLAGMAAYIRQHAILPTAAEYMANRGDLPDESTIRERLGGWTAAWREALRIVVQPADTHDQEIARLKNDGLTNDQVAEQLGLRLGVVTWRIAHMRAAGVNIPKSRATAPDINDRIIEMLSRGVSRAEISQALGISPRAVVSRVSKLRKKGRLAPAEAIKRGVWEETLMGDWPLTTAALGAKLGSANASAFLADWMRRGRVERIGHGVYGLSLESRKRRTELLADK